MAGVPGGRARDLTGRRFGRLVAQRQTRDRANRVAWVCACDCGATWTTLATSLVSGKTRSCGCLRTEQGLRALAISHEKLRQKRRAARAAQEVA